ncbi:MAG: hypothetical protein J6S24_01795, partial [Lentisphaeria bacterium]|nr:hypothetical protein [Lentisphaeria bacterium]
MAVYEEPGSVSISPFFGWALLFFSRFALFGNRRFGSGLFGRCLNIRVFSAFGKQFSQCPVILQQHGILAAQFIQLGIIRVLFLQPSVEFPFG